MRLEIFQAKKNEEKESFLILIQKRNEGKKIDRRKQKENEWKWQTMVELKINKIAA